MWTLISVCRLFQCHSGQHLAHHQREDVLLPELPEAENAWVQDGQDWYYMDGEGLASTGWLELSGQTYYLDDSTGKMVTGWKSENGSWYYFGGSGAMDTGWINDNGTWYYAGPGRCDGYGLAGG